MSKRKIPPLLRQPRRTGTKNNEKAKVWIVQRIKDLGGSPKIQEFRWNLNFDYSFLLGLFNLFLLVWGIFNLNFVDFEVGIAIWSYFFWLLMLIVVYTLRTSFLYEYDSYIIARNMKMVEKEFKKENKLTEEIKQAENIYTILAPNDKAEKIILLGANYDSASKSLKSIESVVFKIDLLFTPLIGISAFLSFFITLAGYNDFIFEIIAYICIGIAFFSSILIFFNYSSNNSPGVVNNAASIVCLLKLYELMQNSNLNNTLVIIAFFNAKEENLIGSRAFAESELPRILDKFQIKKQNVEVIILDSVASNDSLFVSDVVSSFFPISREKNLKDYVKNYFKFKDLSLSDKKSFSPSSDHLSFIVKNYKSILISSKYQYSHTKYDVIERLNETRLDQMVLILKELIELKDKNIKFEIN